LGIELLEINGSLKPQTWEQINTLGFRVFAKLPFRFPMVQSFTNTDSVLLVESYNSLRRYLTQPSVEALGLFRYGAVHDPDFAQAIQPYVRKIRERFEGSIYYSTVRNEPFSVDQILDFRKLEQRVLAENKISVPDSLISTVGAVGYRPDHQSGNYLRPFKAYLDRLNNKPVPVFVSSNWLFTMMEKYPDFARIIQLYNSDSEFVFPVPAEQYTRTSAHSLIVLLILLIWCLLAGTYHMSPVYRKSAMRYFLAHAFFVEDVMKRHIRSIGASITILLLNVILAGISLYCISQTSFSSLGLEAISHHYPAVSILKVTELSIFLWGTVLSAALTAFSIVLIKLGNKALKSFRQVLNLYAWPLQLNFVITTIMVTLLMAGDYPRITLVLAVLYAIIHIGAFIATAIDSAKYLGAKKGLFLGGSIGVYLLIVSAVVYWLTIGDLPEAIQLAIYL
jgi:hypothetical protein